MKSKSIKLILCGLSLVMVLCVFSISTSNIYAQGSLTVSAETANIRATADVNADKVTNVPAGTNLVVEAQTKDSAGATWYKVTVENKTGYIRADLVKNVTGDIPSEEAPAATATPTPTATATPTPKPTAAAINTTVNPTDVKAAKTTDNVSVRAGASTETQKKATANRGTEVTVKGEATDSTGRLWYQISYGNVEGFIRSDFLEVTEVASTQAEATEAPEEIVEETESEVVINSDFEVKYEATQSGEMEWYLYDHQKGTKQTISNIYALMDQGVAMAESGDGSSKILKIAVIALAVVVIALIITVVILFMKLRDGGYDDYDDYDEEPENDEDIEDDYDEDEYEPVKRRRFPLGLSRRNTRRLDDFEEDFEDDEDYEEDDYEEEAPRKSSREGARRRPSSKGMLDVDDDVDFEFLDLD